ncbi:MAG: hypothetical protein R3A52_24150 [Polyangiales bacterium]
MRCAALLWVLARDDLSPTATVARRALGQRGDSDLSLDPTLLTHLARDAFEHGRAEESLALLRLAIARGDRARRPATLAIELLPALLAHLGRPPDAPTPSRGERAPTDFNVYLTRWRLALAPLWNDYVADFFRYGYGPPMRGYGARHALTYLLGAVLSSGSEPRDRVFEVARVRSREGDHDAAAFYLEQYAVHHARDPSAVEAVTRAVDEREAAVLAAFRAGRIDACDAVIAGIFGARILRPDGRRALTPSEEEACWRLPETTDARDRNPREPPPEVVPLLVSRVLALVVGGDPPWSATSTARAPLFEGGPDAPRLWVEAVRLVRAMARYGYSGRPLDVLTILRVPGGFSRFTDGSESQRAAASRALAFAWPRSEVAALLPRPSFGGIQTGDRSAAVRALGRAYSAVGPDAPRLFREAALLLEASVRDDGEPEAQMRLRGAVALAWTRSGDRARALAAWRANLAFYDAPRQEPESAVDRDWRMETRRAMETSFAAAMESLPDLELALEHRLAVAHNPRFRVLLDQEDFAAAQLTHAAGLLSHLRRWDALRDTWREVAARSTEPELRAEARFFAARVPFTAERWREAVAAFTAYLRAATEVDDVPYRVRASTLLARAWDHLSNPAAANAARDGAVQTFRDAPSLPDTPEAEAVAEILSARLDAAVTAFTHDARTLSATARDASLTRIARDADEVRELGQYLPPQVDARVRRALDLVARGLTVRAP